MLLGRSYADVRQEIQERFDDIETGTTKGITYLDVSQMLHEGGYWGQLRYKWYFHNKQREVWPPEPWAPLHYCEVVVNNGSGGSHAVVMLEDGSVLDPLTTETRRLSDYEKVNLVIGLRS